MHVVQSLYDVRGKKEDLILGHPLVALSSPLADQMEQVATGAHLAKQEHFMTARTALNLIGSFVVDLDNVCVLAQLLNGAQFVFEVGQRVIVTL